MLSEEDLSYLSGEVSQVVRCKGPVYAWIVGDNETRKSLEGVGFRPPHGTLTLVNDPDGKVSWWNMNSKNDYIVEEIEKDGSVTAYLNNPDLKREFNTHHFKLTLAEEVIATSNITEYGETKENQLLIALTYFCFSYSRWNIERKV